MKSFKQWQLVNESFLSGMTLGLKSPQTLGGIQSNRPLISEKKKMDGKVVVDDEDLSDDHEEKGNDKKSSESEKCSCNKKMKKKMSSKKKMGDEIEGNYDDEDSDDVNNVKAPDSKNKRGNKDDEGDEGGEDEEGDEGDEGGEDEEGDEGDEGDEGGEDEGGDEGAKYGFMKDKKKKEDKKTKKEKKEKKKIEENFWKDISSYKVPKNSQETEKEFFESLSRQYGKPSKEKFSSGIQGDGINEDLLLSPEQIAMINSMNPGEVGFSPSQRLGGGFMASGSPDLENSDETYEESAEYAHDFEILCKYFKEDKAREIINRKN